MSEIHNANVDFDGLMRVLGEHLYSTPAVVLRELVQNAHDSCTRRQLEDGDAFDPDVEVRANEDKLRLQIFDNGAGLTHDEIIDYLATVGAGYTRLLRAKAGDQSLIGAFGLGFLSAYVVADKVTVYTTSYQTPDETWRFTSKGGRTFSLERVSEARPVGSEVRLELKERFRELAQPSVVEALLRRYCCLLPLPIRAPGRVNEETPPWRRSISDLAARRRAEMGFVSRFESYFQPLVVFPIEHPKVKGLLWVQDGSTYGTSDNRRVTLFVRGMFISQKQRELLPSWAGWAGAVLECDALSPTASREDVQEDEVYYEVQRVIHAALIEGLAEVARAQPEAWRSVLNRHNEALLGSALSDQRLFSLLKADLRLPTTEGLMTAPHILKRTENTLYVGAGEQRGSEEILFQATRIPVIDGQRYGARPFARRYAETQGARLVELGTHSGDAAIFKPAQVAPETQARLEGLFGEVDLKLTLSEFEPSALPAVLVLDQEVLLKRRLEDDEADRRIASGVLGLARLFTGRIQDQGLVTLYLNLNAPTVQGTLRAPDAVALQVASMIKAQARLMSRATGPAAPNMADTLKVFEEGLLALLYSRV